MRINEAEVSHLAEVVVGALLKQGYVRPKASEKAIVERIAKLILDNLKTEEALEAEAEQMAEKLGRQALGMDHRKIVEGIKARLAKERGFTL